MSHRYAVDACPDDQGALRNVLHQISGEGGHVISITWQPDREVLKAGYTIVSEHERAGAQ